MIDTTELENETKKLRNRYRDYAVELHQTERRSQYLMKAMLAIDSQITRYAAQIEDIRSMIAAGDLSYMEDETCAK